MNSYNYFRQQDHGTSFVPNKLFCYCRSSQLIHNKIPDKYDFDSEVSFLFKQYIFDEVESLIVYKISSLTTQKEIKDLLFNFNIHLLAESKVLLFVASPDEVPINAINHIRILIEEFEAAHLAEQDKSSGQETIKSIPPLRVFPKLYVFLLHFPPRYFFSHSYPALFLHGWDHFYLDTIGPSLNHETVAIENWFLQSCDITIESFLSEEAFNKLIMAAVVLVASDIHLKQSDLLFSVNFKTKNDYFAQVLFSRGLDKIIYKGFMSYWNPSIMIEISEQAANLARRCESTLSMSDAISTIIKSNLYNYLIYMLSVMSNSQAIQLLLDSNPCSELEHLILILLQHYPKPKTLSELKIRSVQIKQLREHKAYKFPFFIFIYGVIENILNRTKKIMAKEEIKPAQEQSNDDLYKALVERLEDVLTDSKMSFIVREY